MKENSLRSDPLSTAVKNFSSDLVWTYWLCCLHKTKRHNQSMTGLKKPPKKQNINSKKNPNHPKKTKPESKMKDIIRKCETETSKPLSHIVALENGLQNPELQWGGADGSSKKCLVRTAVSRLVCPD